MSFNYKNLTQGSTLVEVLVAILIMGIVLTGLALALTYSLKNSAQADYRQLATRHAQDVIEILRKERSAMTWSQFSTALPNGAQRCVSGSATTIAGFQASTACSATVTNVSVAQSPVSFTRTISVSNSGGLIEVTVTVAWKDGTANRNVQLIQQFRDIN